MASSQAVYIKVGDQPKAFPFGNQVSYTTSTTTTQSSLPIYKDALHCTFQAIVAGTGAVTATVTIQGSNDDNTGRGFVLGGANAPGIQATTTSGANSLTSSAGSFTQSLVGATITGPGIPVGTTVSSVTNSTTIVMSGNASASGTVQVVFYANNWITTGLGTITLSGTTTNTDGFATVSAWRYVRANVTAISGTGATVQILMGV